MSNKTLPKNVSYAIRMLSFHTRLVNQYTNTINKYIEKNNRDCKKRIYGLINKESNDNQCTIYDYLEEDI